MTTSTVDKEGRPALGANHTTCTRGEDFFGTWGRTGGLLHSFLCSQVSAACRGEKQTRSILGTGEKGRNQGEWWMHGEKLQGSVVPWSSHMFCLCHSEPAADTI